MDNFITELLAYVAEEGKSTSKTKRTEMWYVVDSLNDIMRVYGEGDWIPTAFELLKSGYHIIQPVRTYGLWVIDSLGAIRDLSAAMDSALKLLSSNKDVNTVKMLMEYIISHGVVPSIFLADGFSYTQYCAMTSNATSLRDITVDGIKLESIVSPEHSPDAIENIISLLSEDVKRCSMKFYGCDLWSPDQLYALTHLVEKIPSVNWLSLVTPRTPAQVIRYMADTISTGTSFGMRAIEKTLDLVSNVYPNTDSVIMQSVFDHTSLNEYLTAYNNLRSKYMADGLYLDEICGNELQPIISSRNTALLKALETYDSSAWIVPEPDVV